jgi:hypothetical protein
VAIPALTSPTLPGTDGEDVSTQPVFVYSQVTGATAYEIQVSTDGTFTDAAALAIDATGANRLGNQLAYQSSTVTLQPATTYFWRVRSYNSTTGITGAYSPASAFRTEAGATADGVAADTALQSLTNTGNLELVSAFDYASAAYNAYVPGLAGNALETIKPNTVIFVTVTATTSVVVSGIAYNVTANTPTPIPVGAAVTIQVG